MRTRATPTCSVVIPCFNAIRTIGETVDSARAQTLRDIEIIVVDDGSSDGSADVVAALADTDHRIRLIRQANGGVSAARNRGIAEARSRTIALLDADDLWAPDHVAVRAACLAADPTLGVSFSVARFVDGMGAVVGLARPRLTGLAPADFLTGNPTTTCSAIVARKSVFTDVGLFRTDMRRNEDQEWLFRVALAGWSIAGDPIPRVDYRVSPAGLASDLEGMYRGFETMLAEAAKLAPHLVRRHKTRARATMQRYLARRALRLGMPGSVARHYILAALRSDPTLALAEPRATLATLAASFTPASVLAPLLRRRFSGQACA